MDERDYIAMNKELKTKSMKSKSAVEFLVETLAENGILHSSDIEQANEMFKQQLKEMYLKGIENYDPTFTRKS